MNEYTYDDIRYTSKIYTSYQVDIAFIVGLTMGFIIGLTIGCATAI